MRNVQRKIFSDDLGIIMMRTCSFITATNNMRCRTSHSIVRFSVCSSLLWFGLPLCFAEYLTWNECLHYDFGTLLTVAKRWHVYLDLLIFATIARQSSHQTYVLTGVRGLATIDVSCKGSDINVNFFVPNDSFISFNLCLLEYICFLPDEHSTTPREIHSSIANVVTLQPHYNATSSTRLPGGTVCTVRGCYENAESFAVFAFNQNCTTGETMIANMYKNSTA